MFNRTRRPERSDLNNGVRSPLLEEFRANKTRKWELRNLFGHVNEFSADQHGSRFIQIKLDTATPEEKQMVFDEILAGNIMPLVTDVFGNYVIQKLIEFGGETERNAIFEAMQGHFLILSWHMYGCRVVQKAIEYITPEQQSQLIAELAPDIMKCVKDANGNHVVQKLIERVSPDRLTFVEAFKGSVYDLSTHTYGCRVLQRCLEHLTEEQTRPLLDELHEHTANLMQDQFGNYVVQFVLEHGQPEDRARVIAKLRGQMLMMACHKFASNVCEKALMTADSESRRLLIDELMTPKPNGVSPVQLMMKDQFANYVLQRALSVVEGDQLQALASRIRPHLGSMRKFTAGSFNKHLTASK
ncbi:ARM repeat-containing protein [Dacryopinax primogenitus]|uniref:Pumilio homology domain family member 3 n=1 Tax=Dacryopinax primogenitus (strain DJM 731) TaxID=1858805 RepID=M5GET3_DACPD|nr:ARM repeat-containing protein [Dacryopinax primogenitus]EJU05662.1 ARM repeat-containing protein [Dacryopinax primogenitus]